MRSRLLLCGVLSLAMVTSAAMGQAFATDPGNGCGTGINSVVVNRPAEFIEGPFGIRITKRGPEYLVHMDKCEAAAYSAVMKTKADILTAGGTVAAIGPLGIEKILSTKGAKPNLVTVVVGLSIAAFTAGAVGSLKAAAGKIDEANARCGTRGITLVLSDGLGETLGVTWARYSCQSAPSGSKALVADDPDLSDLEAETIEGVTPPGFDSDEALQCSTDPAKGYAHPSADGEQWLLDTYSGTTTVEDTTYNLYDIWAWDPDSGNYMQRDGQTQRCGRTGRLVKIKYVKHIYEQSGLILDPSSNVVTEEDVESFSAPFVVPVNVNVEARLIPLEGSSEYGEPLQCGGNSSYHTIANFTAEAKAGDVVQASFPVTIDAENSTRQCSPFAANVHLESIRIDAVVDASGNAS